MPAPFLPRAPLPRPCPCPPPPRLAAHLAPASAAAPPRRALHAAAPPRVQLLLRPTAGTASAPPRRTPLLRPAAACPPADGGEPATAHAREGCTVELPRGELAAAGAGWGTGGAAVGEMARAAEERWDRCGKRTTATYAGNSERGSFRLFTGAHQYAAAEDFYSMAYWREVCSSPLRIALLPFR